MGKNRVPTQHLRWFFLLLVFSSCHTIQRDLHISSIDESARAELTEIERTIVRLEFAPAGNIINETRRKIDTLANIPDPDFQTLLAAWSGRLFLLEGRSVEAQRELGRSQLRSRENWVSVILASRLERDIQRRMALLDAHIHNASLGNYAEEEGLGELHIERGRILLEQNRFPEAVASFDLAFGLLEDKPFYQESYRFARDRAWNLRNIDENMESRLVEIAAQDGISWLDLVEITKSETDLLRFLTAGRDWPNDEIFGRLLERSFIPLTQNITLTEWPQARPLPDETVLRSGTAWFLWHLYAENRANRGFLSRYSSRYANITDARSPVGDLPMNSPFFDSILGCVEWEFMNLPDGRNFFPEQRVRGSIFLEMLKRLN